MRFLFAIIRLFPTVKVILQKILSYILNVRNTFNTTNTNTKFYQKIFHKGVRTVYGIWKL